MDSENMTEEPVITSIQRSITIDFTCVCGSDDTIVLVNDEREGSHLGCCGNTVKVTLNEDGTFSIMVDTSVPVLVVNDPFLPVDTEF